MQTRCYQYYTTLSQANAASIQIVNPGWITGVKWSAFIDSLADNSTVQAELSFQSNSNLATHNPVGVIDTIASQQNVQAAPVGQSTTGVNQQTSGLMIPVAAGNIVYLNTTLTGGAVKVILQVLEQ